MNHLDIKHNIFIHCYNDNDGTKECFLNEVYTLVLRFIGHTNYLFGNCSNFEYFKNQDFLNNFKVKLCLSGEIFFNPTGNRWFNKKMERYELYSQSDSLFCIKIYIKTLRQAFSCRYVYVVIQNMVSVMIRIWYH